MTNNRLEEMPPQQTLHAMFEKWRLSFPERYRLEPDAPNTKQLEDAWIAGFAKHNEITCAAQSPDARPAVAADARELIEQWRQDVWEHDPRERNDELIRRITDYANQRGEERWRAGAEAALATIAEPYSDGDGLRTVDPRAIDEARAALLAEDGKQK